MGSSACQTCQNTGGDYKNGTFSSLNQIEIQFKKYAENNLIGLYGRRIQTTIEKLFTLEQFHLCDLIVKLSCEHKKEERDRILLDVEAINLQQLDHLTSIQQIFYNKLGHVGNASDIYLSEEGNQKDLKLVAKKNLRFKESQMPDYEKMLQLQRVVIIANVECFGNSGSLKPSSLPTKRSPLQLFLQKVETINLRIHCSLLVVFIVNPQHQKEFDVELDRILKIRDLQSSRDTQTSLYDFKCQKILYKPVFPCVDQNRKILVQNNRIQFDYRSGDYIGFLMKETTIEKYLKKYQYFQLANINNFAEEVVERQSLLYLQSHQETQLIAHVNQGAPGFMVFEDFIRLRRSFIESEVWKGQKITRNVYSLNHTYYFKSSLFKQGQHNQLFHKLISTKFKAQNFAGIPNNEHCKQFVRTIDSILYSPITLIIIKDKIEFTSNKRTPEIQYSNYCKHKIGLKDSTDDEIVQICPQVLFGSKESFKKIVDKLKSLPKIGFPLVVNRQRTEVQAGQ